MAEEKRITDALKDYWEALRGERKFPTENEIDSAKIADIWDHCFLAKAENGKFVYDFLGEGIIEAYADNMEGEEVVEDQIFPESPALRSKFQEVVDEQEPLFYDGAFINKNNMDIKFRKILLPLGDNGKVDYVLGAMRWKAF